MTQQFIVTAPDGTKYNVTAPDDATEQDAIAYAREQYGAGSTVGNAPPPAVPEAKPLSPYQSYQKQVGDYEQAVMDWRQKNISRLTPSGKTIEQLVTEDTGLEDPRTDEARTKAMIEELKAGGDLQYETPGYDVAKLGASVGGFALGGPFGAIGAEAGVRHLQLLQQLKKAVDAGAITEDRASEIALKEMARGTTEDAMWNIGIPVLGQALRRIPGVEGIVSRMLRQVPGKALDEQMARKVERLKKMTATPEQSKAVEELAARSGGKLPTPGQVTGEAGGGEQYARIGAPGAFEKQQQALQQSVEGLREDTLMPPSQPSRYGIGETIQDVAEKTQAAMKKRLRPVFEAADQSGVQVDFTDVLARAKAALAKSETVPGGKLDPAEKAALSKIVDDLEGLAKPAAPAGAASQVPTGMLDASGNPIMKTVPGAPAQAAVPPRVGAEAALDFMSRQKETLRGLSADHKPTDAYEVLVKQLIDDADKSFGRAAMAAGKGNIVSDLSKAREQYREMMGTVYEDALKQTMRTNKPEDVGRFFWQAGNVSEPQQLQKLLAIAQREGVASGADREALTKAMVRGFLQDAVPDVKAAANWSQMLKAKAGRRDTWEALTSGPGGAELRTGMGVLEQAAKMAERGDAEMVGPFLGSGLARRIRTFGPGISAGYGLISPTTALVGLTAIEVSRLLSIAYTEGNKGMMNMITRALRARSAGTAVGAKAMQAAWPAIAAYAEQHGIQVSPFKGSDQPSEPQFQTQPQGQ